MSNKLSLCVKIFLILLSGAQQTAAGFGECSFINAVQMAGVIDRLVR